MNHSNNTTFNPISDNDLDEASISLTNIRNLRKFGNKLLSCKSVEEICTHTFELIKKEINPQVSSIFLFLKDGYIERIGINGIDRDRKEIHDEWLVNKNIRERYLPGQGFSGVAAKVKKGDIYGEPLLSKNLEQDFKLIFGKEYKEKLGFLKCAISVPLNGTHHTFGTIEVINKINPETGYGDEEALLTERDLCWLTIVGSHVSAAISRLRKSKKDEIITYLTLQLVQKKYFESNIFQTVAEMLTEEKLMPYKACIIRLMQQDNFLPVTGAAATWDIDIKHKGYTSRNINEGMIGKVCRNKQPIEINKISENINDFLSKEWIIQSKLESFFCYPLLIQGEAVGVISLFTGYEHYLYDNDRSFLNTISYLLAAYRVGVYESKYEDNEIRVPFDLPEGIDKALFSSLINSSPDNVDKNYKEVVLSIKRKYQSKIKSQEQGIYTLKQEIENLKNIIINHKINDYRK